MYRFDERLKEMLRGRLPESERQELEAWFLCSDAVDTPSGLDSVRRVEEEILDAWFAGDLEAAEAVTVLHWQAARRRRDLVASLETRARRAETVLEAAPTVDWVM